MLAHIPKFNKFVNGRLAANDSKLSLVGSRVTIADFTLAAVYFDCIENPDGPFYSQVHPLIRKGEYPLVDAYLENLAVLLKNRLTVRGPRPF